MFRTTRWNKVFLIKGVYNIAVGTALLIWADALLPIMGPSAGNPTYVQLFLVLVLAFGAGYVLVGLDIDSNHGIVATGILGQMSLFVVVFWNWTRGNVYLKGLVPGVVDLAFAVAFAVFLWTYDYNRRHRTAVKSTL